MSPVPCFRVQWLLTILSVSLAIGLIQAQHPFPGEITHYPARHYVIKGQDFNTSCVVTLDDTDVKLSFMWQLSNIVLSNSSNVTITPAVRIGNQVMGMLIIQNAVFSDSENLKCLVFGTFKRKYVTVNRTSSIRSSVVPFVITNFPSKELQLPLNSPYMLQCVVKVDEHFILEAVVVTIRYSPISLDNNEPLEEHNNQKMDRESRTLTVSVSIRDVERRFGGTYECVAKTHQLQNAVIPNYKVYNRTTITRASTVDDTESSQDSSDDSSDKDWLTLLLAFSAITVILLVVFTALVAAVIWTKKHRSRNYSVSPFLGTIPTTSASAKSNYYLDSPENATAVKVPLQSAAMALHITPRLQSISSVETDI